jgi:hypothetical protein
MLGGYDWPGSALIVQFVRVTNFSTALILAELANAGAHIFSMDGNDRN